MRCRNIHFEKDASGNILRRDIVWFGSYGLNHDGTAKKANNYSENQKAVSDSLTQRLNVLQGELWYSFNEGFPLWDNHKNVNVLDAYISEVILNHPDVKSILEFNSKIERVEGQQYSIYISNVKILTKYGEISINFNQNV